MPSMNGTTCRVCIRKLSSVKVHATSCCTERPHEVEIMAAWDSSSRMSTVDDTKCRRSWPRGSLTYFLGGYLEWNTIGPFHVPFHVMQPRCSKFYFE